MGIDRVLAQSFIVRLDSEHLHLQRNTLVD